MKNFIIGALTTIIGIITGGIAGAVGFGLLLAYDDTTFKAFKEIRNK